MTKKSRSASKSGKAGSVLVSFLLDETGSMQSCFDATLSGFNEYIRSLRDGRGKGKVVFSLTKFNSNETRMVHSAIPIQDVPALDKHNYNPEATTPLYDAIGRTVWAMEGSLKALAEKVQVIVVILTDGEENASVEFTQAQIFKLITAKKKEGWTFVFLGADQDAYRAAERLGVDRANAMAYDSRDTRAMYHTLAQATNQAINRGRGKSGFFGREKREPAKS